MHRLLVDINVIIDVASKRSPYQESSSKVLGLIESKKIAGYLSAISFPTIHYLIRKELKGRGAIMFLKDLISIFSVVEVDKYCIDRAIDMETCDFEDAIQMASAEKIKAHYIISRDADGYGGSPVQAVTPAEYLATFYHP